MRPYLLILAAATEPDINKAIRLIYLKSHKACIKETADNIITL